jgi:hypothetical protein
MSKTASTGVESVNLNCVSGVVFGFDVFAGEQHVVVRGPAAQDSNRGAAKSRVPIQEADIVLDPAGRAPRRQCRGAG